MPENVAGTTDFESSRPDFEDGGDTLSTVDGIKNNGTATNTTDPRGQSSTFTHPGVGEDVRGVHKDGTEQAPEEDRNNVCATTTATSASLVNKAYSWQQGGSAKRCCRSQSCIQGIAVNPGIESRSLDEGDQHICRGEVKGPAEIDGKEKVTDVADVTKPGWIEG